YGTFTHNNGTVDMNGVLSSVYGSTTFYNLTKTETVPSSIYFEYGQTQTITGELTLSGVIGAPLALESTSGSGSFWNLDPQGTRSISYVTVNDSNNINSTLISGTNMTDGGHNIGWDLPVVPDPTWDPTFYQDFELAVPPTGWTSAGDVPWAQTNAYAIDGSNSAVSGNIDDDQTSVMSWEVTVSEASNLRFDWQSSSEEGFDYGVFCIDTPLCDQYDGYTQVISGITGSWTTIRADLATGSHTLTWKYIKDSSVSEGDDAVYVDGLKIWTTVEATPTPSPTPTPTATPAANTVTSGTTTTGSSHSSTDSNTVNCTQETPHNAPNLFQINTTNTQATLYFAPSSKPYDGYSIAYGTKEHQWQHAITFKYSNDGVGSYTISDLNPNTTYEFRVQALNGCAAGAWSNSTQATTKTNFVLQDFLETTVVPQALLNKEISYNSFEVKPTQEEQLQKKATSPQTSDTSQYTLTAKVVADDTGKPLSNVAVTLHSKVQHGVTNEKGEVTFTNVEPGDHQLLLAYGEYTGEKKFTVEGENKNLTVEMKITLMQTGFSVLSKAIIASLLLLVLILTILTVRMIQKTRKLRKKIQQQTR
ncbi:fibronectin type III domain-containing protein, partial [Candidatus Woesebacteria bacterium]|nr:fibronectin type III domain-containing protein [Candidatus Woesebacteria bacterium]